MINESLTTVSLLNETGNYDEAYQLSVKLASMHRENVRTQLAAAYACDRQGFEEEAITYYEAALALDIPFDERRKFLISFGSTLRNVGRIKEAVDCLTEASIEYPDRAEIRAFLALALHSAGKTEIALATMLEAALMAARPDGFDVYSRALAEYQQELSDAPHQTTPK